MNIQSLTVQHDLAEDRIALLARDAERQQLLLLTRHLSFRLLEALARELQQQQGDERLAQVGLEDELLSMKHARALGAIREVQRDQAPPPVIAAVDLPVALVREINLHPTRNGRILVFRAEPKRELARLALDNAQLHWFVGRITTHAQKAGWGKPIPVPGWLEPAGPQSVPGNIEGSLH